MSLATQIKRYFGPDTMPFGPLSKSPVMLDKKYLDWIRTQPCIVTGSLGVDAHHVIYKSQADNDYSAVPLRHDKHMELHNHKDGVEGFEEDNDINFEQAMIAKMMEYLFLMKQKQL